MQSVGKEFFEDLTISQITEFIDKNEWRFAKTMAEIPHAYCLREKCNDANMFERFVMHIRKNGYKKSFFNKTYIYFDVGQFQYWTMGNPLHKTKLINRAKLQKSLDT